MSIERKFLRHLLNATPSSTPTWKVLGKDLEEYNTELNANVDKKQNILGETSIKLTNYEVQASVEPYYAEEDDELTEFLQDLIDNRKVLEKVKTDLVEVQLWNETATNSGIFTAYKEVVYVEVTSYGGDTTGYQIQFNIHHTGIRVKGTYNTANNTFAAGVSA